MKTATHCMLVISMLCGIPGRAAIHFGSRRAAIETTAGSFTFNSDAIGMSKGTLYKRGAGSFSNTAGDYLDCSKMAFHTEVATTQKGMDLDGKLYLTDGTLTLESNDVLDVKGGQVAETVTVAGAAGTPSIVRGNGSFAAGLSVNATRELLLDWHDAMNQDITLKSTSGTTTLTLENDLHFASGYGPVANSSAGTALIDFNGYNMSMGGVTVGSTAQSWKDARLDLSGDLTISADITLTNSAAQINAHGHKLTISGGFLGSVGGTITDAYFPSYDAGYLGGTGDWYAVNTVFDDGTQRVRVVDGQLDGGTVDLFQGNATWNDSANLELLSDVTLKGRWRFVSNSYIMGNGFNIFFEDSNATLEYDSNLFLRDLSISNVVNRSFDDGVSLYLNNVTWRDSDLGRAVRITSSSMTDEEDARMLLFSSGISTQSNIFEAANYVYWANGAHIELLSNINLETEWTFVNVPSVFDGNGHSLDLSGSAHIDYNSADLYFNNISLVGIEQNSFDCGSGTAYELCFNNVHWIDANGQSLHITGSTEGSGVGHAVLQLPAGTAVGDLFGQAVTWENGANIQLNSSIQFTSGAAWTFSENSVLEGNGHLIDFNSITSPINVADNKTLSVSNAVISGWGNGKIVLGTGATLEFTNVTIIMDGDYTPDLTGETLIFNGGCTVVTGGYSFAPTGMSLEVYGTLWYDSLGRQDNTFVNFGSGPFTGGGQVMMLPLNKHQDIIFERGSSYLVSSSILNYDVSNGLETYFGRTVTFNNSSAFTLKGGGRSFYMNNLPGVGASSIKLITVSGSVSNTVELEDLTLDGWSPEHITDTNDLIRYGNGSVIRLHEDITLASVVSISNASSGDTVTLDLNGHQLDMDSDSAAFDIAATNVNFVIKNGRIMNLNDNGVTTKFLLNSGTTSTVTFQDCDIVLNGAARMLNNNVTFKGECKVTGTTDATLSLYGTNVTIGAGAHLTIDKNMTLEMRETNATISFGSQNATLELFGATLDASNLTPFSLTGGTLRIDDLATLNGSMTLGGSGASNLDIELQPAASLKVTSGTITYSNDS